MWFIHQSKGFTYSATRASCLSKNASYSVKNPFSQPSTNFSALELWANNCRDLNPYNDRSLRPEADDLLGQVNDAVYSTKTKGKKACKH
jgi:hypothetical protein